MTKSRRVELKMPWLDSEVATVVVSGWLAEEGQAVEIDQDLLELKVDGEIFLLPSPLDGVLVSREVEPGDYLEVGQILGMIEEEEIGE